jgi:ribosomal protein L12E/L44/L45/RPP1/RPP2
MQSRLKTIIDRRDILRNFAIGTVAAAASAAQPLPAAADTENDAEKRKARYQPDSPEVQNFYRVNRYPPT